MSLSQSRRDFFKRATVGALGLCAVRPATADEVARGSRRVVSGQRPAGEPPPADGKYTLDDRFKDFSRWYPSYGGPPDSDTYHGKLVGGFRPPGLPPVPVESPDVPKVPYKIVDGWKEFHLFAEHVRREFLPGKWIDVHGYNGVMPGPTIECTIGDPIRVVVHNRLPTGTTVHFHGAEDDVEDDGVPGITQDLIPPGEAFVYEFEIHQTGSFFYHAHVPMQEAFGMAGSIILHPKIAEDPPVDRDFMITFQQWQILPNNTIPYTLEPMGSWLTINGRAFPYTTPMVVKHGERVRIRVHNFSKNNAHSIHLRGHTFWITGAEGSRWPKTAWQLRNTTMIHIAQIINFEFIANNPGDWLLHCQMAEHMINFVMRAQNPGPRMREERDISAYKRNLDVRPPVTFPSLDPGTTVPGYPLHFRGYEYTENQLRKILGRREVRGMREGWWNQNLGGLVTLVRVLPEELYNRVMLGNEPIAPGEIYQAIVEGRDRWRKGA